MHFRFNLGAKNPFKKSTAPGAGGAANGSAGQPGGTPAGSGAATAVVPPLTPEVRGNRLQAVQQVASAGQRSGAAVTVQVPPPAPAPARPPSPPLSDTDRDNRLIELMRPTGAGTSWVPPALWSEDPAPHYGGLGAAPRGGRPDATVSETLPGYGGHAGPDTHQAAAPAAGQGAAQPPSYTQVLRDGPQAATPPAPAAQVAPGPSSASVDEHPVRADGIKSLMASANGQPRAARHQIGKQVLEKVRQFADDDPLECLRHVDSNVTRDLFEPGKGPLHDLPEGERMAALTMLHGALQAMADPSGTPAIRIKFGSRNYAKHLAMWGMGIAASARSLPTASAEPLLTGVASTLERCAPASSHSTVPALLAPLQAFAEHKASASARALLQRFTAQPPDPAQAAGNASSAIPAAPHAGPAAATSGAHPAQVVNREQLAFQARRVDTPAAFAEVLDGVRQLPAHERPQFGPLLAGALQNFRFAGGRKNMNLDGDIEAGTNLQRNLDVLFGPVGAAHGDLRLQTLDAMTKNLCDAFKGMEHGSRLPGSGEGESRAYAHAAALAASCLEQLPGPAGEGLELQISRAAAGKQFMAAIDSAAQGSPAMQALARHREQRFAAAPVTIPEPKASELGSFIDRGAARPAGERHAFGTKAADAIARFAGQYAETFVHRYQHVEDLFDPRAGLLRDASPLQSRSALKSLTSAFQSLSGHLNWKVSLNSAPLHAVGLARWATSLAAVAQRAAPETRDEVMNAVLSAVREGGAPLRHEIEKQQGSQGDLVRALRAH